MAETSSAIKAPFRMGMAGTCLEIVGPASWLTPLRRAWAAWPPAEGIAGWSVSLVAATHLPPPTAPLFEALPHCRGDVCRLEAPGFVGEIDTITERATLSAHPQATPGDIGYFLRVALAIQAFKRGGILFHAAGVIHRGQGYALFGRSGSGKSTAASFSAFDPLLNDDLILLWPAATGWLAHATPFGQTRAAERQAPLRACLWLVKDPEVYLAPLGRARALGELMANTPVISGNPQWCPSLLRRWETLLAQIEVLALHLRRDPTFWEVIDAHFA